MCKTKPAFTKLFPKLSLVFVLAGLFSTSYSVNYIVQRVEGFEIYNEGTNTYPLFMIFADTAKPHDIKNSPHTVDFKNWTGTTKFSFPYEVSGSSQFGHIWPNDTLYFLPIRTVSGDTMLFRDEDLDTTSTVSVFDESSDHFPHYDNFAGCHEYVYVAFLRKPNTLFEKCDSLEGTASCQLPVLTQKVNPGRQARVEIVSRGEGLDDAAVDVVNHQICESGFAGNSNGPGGWQGSNRYSLGTGGVKRICGHGGEQDFAELVIVWFVPQIFLDCIGVGGLPMVIRSGKVHGIQQFDRVLPGNGEVVVSDDHAAGINSFDADMLIVATEVVMFDEYVYTPLDLDRWDIMIPSIRI